MSNTVIKVEGLGKKYLLRHQQEGRSQYKSLRDVITRTANNLLNPTSLFRNTNKSKEEFWALRDLFFEIKQGDRVGVIGRNGAGKSTLLKTLSRITTPSTGKISITGRIASLLEVGTGFHPELTGRENIFLNGAILGMTKQEIKNKFDEIVDFAEVEKFLDTPVKRYSSGMYVRLAFSVAAHLEPEILIVDEVLAVGDLAFQKKCLGKMGEVGENGRTIIFVSHNMGSIQQLCDSVIYLQKGEILNHGKTDLVINEYIKSSKLGNSDSYRRSGNGNIQFEEFHTGDKEGNSKRTFEIGESVFVYFNIQFKKDIVDPVICIQVKNRSGELIAHILNLDDNFHIVKRNLDKVGVKVEIPYFTLAPSEYSIELWIGETMSNACDFLTECMTIEVLQTEAIRRLTPYPSHAKVFLQSKWEQVIN